MQPSPGTVKDLRAEKISLHSQKHLQAHTSPVYALKLQDSQPKKSSQYAIENVLCLCFVTTHTYIQATHPLKANPRLSCKEMLPIRLCTHEQQPKPVLMHLNLVNSMYPASTVLHRRSSVNVHPSRVSATEKLVPHGKQGENR